MNNAHKYLLNKYKWYKHWHENPTYRSIHSFIFYVFVMSFYIAIQFSYQSLNTIDLIDDFTFTTHAQGRPNDLPNKQYVGSVKGRATDRILLKFQPSASEEKQKNILNKHNVQEKASIGKIKIISVPEGMDVDGLIAKIKGEDSDSIEFVETDNLISIELTPNDSLFPQQWSLTKIQADYAWDYAKGNGVLVGDCDTGFDSQHQDLVQNLRADLGYNVVDNSTNWSPVHPHGTMTAGVIAATINNNTGISGVAPEAKIIPVRVSNLSDGSAYVSDLAECIAYSSNLGARVVNVSYLAAGDPAIAAAASDALTKNTVTVVAAGNNGIDTGWSDYTSFLAVSATDINDAKASFSNYGNFIDIAAPGSNVLTTNTGNQYAYVNGTSFSAPTVSGVFALIISINPSISASDAILKVLSTADDIGPVGDDNLFGAGRVNAKRAVESAVGSGVTITLAPSIIPSTMPTLTPTTIPTSTSAPTPTPTVSYQIPSAPTNLTAIAVSPYQINLTWGVSTGSVPIKNYQLYRVDYCSSYPWVKIATVITTSFSDYNQPATCYKYYVVAIDEYGNSSLNSNIAQATTPTAPRKSTPPPSPTPTPKSDFTSPTAPTNVSTTILGPEAVVINWRGSKDNLEVKSYKIYVNNSAFASYNVSSSNKADETNTTFSYNGATPLPLLTYSYRVSAVDTSMNESPKSEETIVTMPGKEGYGNLRGKVTSSGVGLSSVNVSASCGGTAPSTFSNSDGTYGIANLPIGTCKVTYSKKGYATVSKTVSILNKTITQMDVSLNAR